MQPNAGAVIRDHNYYYFKNSIFLLLWFGLQYLVGCVLCNAAISSPSLITQHWVLDRRWRGAFSGVSFT